VKGPSWSRQCLEVARDVFRDWPEQALWDTLWNWTAYPLCDLAKLREQLEDHQREVRTAATAARAGKNEGEAQ
jgi:hypothetical protein